MKPLELIDITRESAGIEHYKNILLSVVNNHVVRLSVMTEPYFWHHHPNSDETFIGVEGTLCIELSNTTIELNPGQMITIPANVKHRTRPKGERSVNLTFESSDIITIKAE